MRVYMCAESNKRLAFSALQLVVALIDESQHSKPIASRVVAQNEAFGARNA